MVGPVWRRGLRHRRGCDPAPGRSGDALDRAVHRRAHAFGRRHLFLHLAEGCKRDHRFERSPELYDRLNGKVAGSAEHPPAMHQRSHRRPPLVARQLVRDQRERANRNRFFAPHVPVLGHSLKQDARGAGLDPPALGQGEQLLHAQSVELGDEAPRQWIEHVRTRQRNHRREWRVVDGELERWQLRPHDQRRHRLPRGDLLFLAFLHESVEEHRARPGHRLGDARVAAADRGLDRARRVRRAAAFLADRAYEAAGGEDLPPLPRRQVGGGDDEGLNFRRVRAKPVGGIVVGPLNTAEQTMGGGRHGHILSASPPA